MSIKLPNIHDIESFMNLRNYPDLYFAYLQGLTSKVFLVHLELSSTALETLLHQRYFEASKKLTDPVKLTEGGGGHATSYAITAILLVTRLSKKPQNLTVATLKSEPLFHKFQSNHPPRPPHSLPLTYLSFQLRRRGRYSRLSTRSRRLLSVQARKRRRRLININYRLNQNLKNEYSFKQLSESPLHSFDV